MKLDVIYNEDCLKKTKRLPNESIDLIIADPPYNINKAEWDKIPNYINWSGKWILECQRVLKDNGSFYWFHNYMPVISRLMIWIEENTTFIFKQFIVWNKKFHSARNEGYLQGYNEVEGLRNYQQMAEYILFYTFQGNIGLEIMHSDKKLFKDIRQYIINEATKAFNPIKKMNIFLGFTENGGMATRKYLGKTQWYLPTQEHYVKLQTTGYFQKPYEDLRREYEDSRYTFNNQKSHHSVWNYEIASKNEHLTPKPIPLIENILRHSSNKNDIVLIPFVGSGNECIACRNLGRYYIGFEISSEYCEIAKKRLEDTDSLFRRKL